MSDEETYQLLKEDYRTSVNIQMAAMDRISLNDYLDVEQYAKMISLRLVCINSSMDLANFISNTVHKQTDAKLLKLKLLLEV